MSWLSRIGNALRSSRMDRELSEELQFHIEEREAQLIREGVAPAEAARQARLRLGNQLAHREASREARLLPRLESLLQDTRYGFRMLRKNPAVNGAAILALSLAVGACTAAFSLIDALVLRPLPVDDPQRLVAFSYPSPYDHRTGDTFSYPLFERLRAASRPWADLFAVTFNSGFETVRFGAGNEENLRINWISGGAFTTLGVTPAFGRLLTPDDETRRGRIAVIGYPLWKRRFGSNPDAVGRWITVAGEPYQIAGVARDGFTGLAPGLLTDLWVPLTTGVDARRLADPGHDFFQVWARLGPGVTPQRAQQSLQPVFTGFRKEQAPSLARTRLTPTQQAAFLNAPLHAASAATGNSTIVREQFAHPMSIFSLIAALVLLLACSNVANLFIARAAAREREMAMRAAVGAGRGRMIQQMLIESSIVALSACALGLLLAQAAAPALVARLMPMGYPAYLDLGLNARIFAFLALAGVAVTLFFGLIPAWRASSVAPLGAMQSGGSKFSARLNILRPLVAAQAGFSFAVLFVAGLLLLSFHNLTSVDLGFAKDGIVLGSLSAPDLREPARVIPAELDLLDRLRQQPGVAAASLSDIAPVSGAFAPRMLPPVRMPGESRASRGPMYQSVAPGFFEAMQMRLLFGRTLAAPDLAPNAAAVVVNESFARRYFPSGALGQRFERMIDDDGNFGPQEIVGVVHDAKYNDLREDPSPVVYAPLRRIHGTQLLVRAAGGADAIAPLLRQQVRNINPAIQMNSVTLESTNIENSIIPERLLALLAGFFALVAGTLAAVGLYGVLSYSVVRQTREIGIRMALGAARSSVVRMVVFDAALMTLLGASAGLALGMALARFVESALFGVKPMNAFTVALPLGAMLLLSAAAALGPAWRAVRVDPGVALRYE